jgi:hypothetical protein
LPILTLQKTLILPRWIPLSLNLVLIALVSAYAPTEKVLGAGMRLVYLHGAWVWTALGIFLAAAGAGLIALLSRRASWHNWSLALGRTGMVFWLTYLPMSLLLMQINWGGFFLAEPRWRVPLAFAVAGLLLQAGLALISSPTLASSGNLLFGAALLIAVNNLESVLHPESPLANSGAGSIQLFFAILLGLTLLSAAQVCLWWKQKI